MAISILIWTPWHFLLLLLLPNDCHHHQPLRPEPYLLLIFHLIFSFSLSFCDCDTFFFLKNKTADVFLYLLFFVSLELKDLFLDQHFRTGDCSLTDKEKSRPRLFSLVVVCTGQSRKRRRRKSKESLLTCIDYQADEASTQHRG